jgi:hypothetical protein
MFRAHSEDGPNFELIATKAIPDYQRRRIIQALLQRRHNHITSVRVPFADFETTMVDIQ